LLDRELIEKKIKLKTQKQSETFETQNLKMFTLRKFITENFNIQNIKEMISKNDNSFNKKEFSKKIVIFKIYQCC
jgi:hypothetical protein